MSTMGINHIIIESDISEKFLMGNFKWNYAIKNGTITVETNKPDSDMIKIIDFMNEHNAKINKIKVKESTLEEIFIKLTNEKK